MELSEESREFLDNLTLYLKSSGKDDEQVTEVVTELEDHLWEAEKHGKNIDSITGGSPKQYMEQLRKAMPFSFSNLLIYLPILILGAFSFVILNKATHGPLTFTALELIAYPLTYIFYTLILAGLFRYISSHTISKLKERIIFYLVALLSIGIFIVLIYINRLISTPAVTFGWWGTLAAVLFAILFFIVGSVWSKTWVLIVIPAALYLPEFIMNYTSVHSEMTVLFSAGCSFLCIAVFIYFSIRKMKKSEGDV